MNSSIVWRHASSTKWREEREQQQRSYTKMFPLNCYSVSYKFFSLFWTFSNLVRTLWNRLWTQLEHSWIAWPLSFNWRPVIGSCIINWAIVSPIQFKVWFDFGRVGKWLPSKYRILPKNSLSQDCWVILESFLCLYFFNNPHSQPNCFYRGHQCSCTLAPANSMQIPNIQSDDCNRK